MGVERKREKGKGEKGKEKGKGKERRRKREEGGGRGGRRKGETQRKAGESWQHNNPQLFPRAAMEITGCMDVCLYEHMFACVRLYKCLVNGHVFMYFVHLCACMCV